MAKNIALKASKREGTGKGVARALRREGKIPAVIYGDQKEAVAIALDGNETTKEYSTGQFFTTLTELDIDGEKQLVLARDAQTHPVKDNVLHIDFLRVTKKTKIPVAIPVVFLNEELCPGLRNGGILSVMRYEVEVFCSALAIPDNVEIDLAELEIGDTVKSSAVTLPEDVTFTITDREFTIAAIEEPKKVVEEEPVAEEGEEGEAAEGEESAEGSEEGSEGGDDAAEEKSE